jgi:hypothetical protein
LQNDAVGVTLPDRKDESSFAPPSVPTGGDLLWG